MTKHILFIQNILREKPGILKIVADMRGYKSTIITADQNTVYPPITNYDAVIILGGPDSANDRSKKIINETIFIKQALNNNIPILGICLGLQLIIKASGGRVLPCPVKEIGFTAPDSTCFSINIQKQFTKDPIIKNMKSPFKVFQLHGETVELSDTMQPIGTGKFCKNQIVKINNLTYGIQCHFELTEKMLKTWAKEDADLKQLNYDSLLSSFNEIKDEYTNTGIKLFDNFLDMI